MGERREWSRGGRDGDARRCGSKLERKKKCVRKFPSSVEVVFLRPLAHFVFLGSRFLSLFCAVPKTLHRSLSVLSTVSLSHSQGDFDIEKTPSPQRSRSKVHRRLRGDSDTKSSIFSSFSSP